MVSVRKSGIGVLARIADTTLLEQRLEALLRKNIELRLNVFDSKKLKVEEKLIDRTATNLPGSCWLQEEERFKLARRVNLIRRVAPNLSAPQEASNWKTGVYLRVGDSLFYASNTLDVPSLCGKKNTGRLVEAECLATGKKFLLSAGVTCESTSCYLWGSQTDPQEVVLLKRRVTNLVRVVKQESSRLFTSVLVYSSHSYASYYILEKGIDQRTYKVRPILPGEVRII